MARHEQPMLDSRYNNSYTDAMKTAISLPDKLFQAAEAFAQEHGLSRSELYARALLLFLQAQRYEGITELLDQVYAGESSVLDPALKAAQARALPQDAW
jgi:metal-responsive CopG/Arc/MetJ family transcriptional regulator